MIHLHSQSFLCFACACSPMMSYFPVFSINDTPWTKALHFVLTVEDNICLIESLTLEIQSMFTVGCLLDVRKILKRLETEIPDCKHRNIQVSKMIID